MCFFPSDVSKNYNLWSCQKVFWITFLLDLELNFIGKLFIPKETNCAPYVADLFLFLMLQICFFFMNRFHEVSLTGKSG